MAASAEKMAREVLEVTLVEKLTAELKALQAELQSTEAKFVAENLALTLDAAHWQKIQKSLVPREDLWWMDRDGTHDMVDQQVYNATTKLEENQLKQRQQLESIRSRITNVTNQLTLCAVSVPDLTTKIAALSLDPTKTASSGSDASRKHAEEQSSTVLTPAYNKSIATAASAASASAAVTVPDLTTTLAKLSLEPSKPAVSTPK